MNARLEPTTPPGRIRFRALVLRFNRLRDRHSAPGHFGMQALDHAAIDGDDALGLVFRQIESGDDFARLGDLFQRGREGLVAQLDLARMNQRLAVKAELYPLRALP